MLFGAEEFNSLLQPLAVAPARSTSFKVIPSPISTNLNSLELIISLIRLNY
jgi:hypothetical protein